MGVSGLPRKMGAMRTQSWLLNWMRGHIGEGRWMLLCFVAGFFRREWRMAVCSAVLIVTSCAMQLLLQRLGKELAESNDGDIRHIVYLCISTVTVVVMYHATSLYGHLFAFRVGQAVYSKMMLHGIAAMCDVADWDVLATTNPAELVQSFAAGAKTSREAVSFALSDFLMSTFTAVGLLATVLYMSFWITVTVGLVVGCTQISTKIYQEHCRRVDSKDAADREAQLIALLTNAVQRSAAVRLFQCRESVLSRVQQRLDNFSCSANHLSKTIHTHAAITSCASIIMFVTLLGVMSYLHGRGEMEVLDIAMYFILMQRLLTCILSMSTGVETMIALLDRVEPLHSITGGAPRTPLDLEEEPATVTREKGTARAAGMQSVELASASYEYPLPHATGAWHGAALTPQEAAANSVAGTVESESCWSTAGMRLPEVRRGIRNVSFSVPLGTLTALCGPSGSGKSTCLLLLSGLISPKRGVVHTDEHPVLLEQKPSLLMATLHENILMGVSAHRRQGLTPTEAEEVVIKASQKSGCHEFITTLLPDGYATHIENVDFAQLSGGQLQRICLARVFASDSRLVLLDEPTTGLDEASADIILQSARVLVNEGRTVIISTHDRRVREMADHVIDMSLQ